MIDNITVSVIVPNYNHALYIQQRIESVLNQSFQDFELIIMDDCSTDNSREIIAAYKDHPKVSNVIFNAENSGGVFKQWIKGIEMAKGKYIWIAESDDFADPNFLEETVQVLNSDESCSMVFTGTTTVNTEGEFITTSDRTKKMQFSSLQKFGDTVANNNAAEFLIADMIIENASSALFRKKNLLNINFSELTKFNNTGDRFVYIGLALQAKVLYLPKLLNFMRSHQRNTTKKSFENGNIHKDRLRVLNFYFDELYQHPTNQQHLTRFYKNNYLYFNNFGDYNIHTDLLKKLKNRNAIAKFVYFLESGYLLLFRKMNMRSKLVRSLYHRSLVFLHNFNNDYQK